DGGVGGDDAWHHADRALVASPPQAAQGGRSSRSRPLRAGSGTPLAPSLSMATKHEQPQPKELTTAERLATTGRAVVQGIKHTLQGEHETEDGGRHTAGSADVEQIIENWPAPQKNIARQMLENYGMPNEATPT